MSVEEERKKEERAKVSDYNYNGQYILCTPEPKFPRNYELAYFWSFGFSSCSGDSWHCLCESMVWMIFNDIFKTLIILQLRANSSKHLILKFVFILKCCLNIYRKDRTINECSQKGFQSKFRFPFPLFLTLSNKSENKAPFSLYYPLRKDI